MRPFLVLAVACSGCIVAQTEPEQAKAAFAKAEELVVRGQYERAISAYRDVAKRWPTTEHGVLAQWRSQPNACLGRAPLQVTGRSENRVDVVVMGDGYTLATQNQFADLARTVPKNFGRDPVLDEYADYHNFWAAFVVSKEDGIDGFNRTYDTALGGRMITGSHEQASVDHGAVMQMLEHLGEPDRLAVVFVRAGHLGTGGGGVAVIGGREDDTVIHEWGHAFVGLADEYIDQQHRGSAQNGINVAGTGDPKQVPWKHWLDAKAPGIGVYEGAAGMQRGAWKPTTGGCVMEHGRYFCPVCREALVLAIHARVDPIDGERPAAGTAIPAADPEVTVDLLRPKTHGLEVSFWVFAEGRAPPAPPMARGDRTQRGPLPEIKEAPEHRVPDAGKQVRWRIPVQGRAPGRYTVVCRVRDDSKVPRDTLPWVLADPRGLLQSERRWTLTVGS